MPPVDTEFLQTYSPHNPLGIKGVGEGGAIGAPTAVANAVADALAPLGVRHVDPPFTAEKLWRLIHDAERRQRAAPPTEAVPTGPSRYRVRFAALGTLAVVPVVAWLLRRRRGVR
jgi:carbon-monoxide dehydrogenase large subunit